jgi:hypothetical protein
MVLTFLHLPGISHNRTPVRFLLDTGASFTCLHPRDAIFAVGIDPATLSDPSRWTDPVDSTGIGGVSPYYRVPAEYVLVHTDGSMQTILDAIYIARPANSNTKIPSLLGWNILKNFRVVTDWPQRYVALE